jgi:hypothetical protein
LAHFVGREDLLDSLHRELSASGAVTLVAVEGMGGAGKTALVTEYIHRYAAEYDAVWWVPAEQPELIGAYLSGLALALGLPADSDAAEVFAALTATHPRWLLIFDNANDSALVAGLLPAWGQGRFLVTSRRTGWRQVGARLKLPTFPRVESVSMLCERFPGLEAATADRIADLLGDLPLAIEQAASYIETTSLPPVEYTRLLADRLTDILRRGSVANRPEVTVATLWELSIRQLEVDCPAAVELLQMCAFCDAEAIPLELFTSVPDALPDGPLRAAVADRLTWSDTVGALALFSLARRDNDTVSVHRLIQAATRNAMTAEQTARIVSTLMGLFVTVLPGEIRDNPEAWPPWRRLLPHVLAVLGEANDANPLDQISQLCKQTATYLLEQGQDGQALPLVRRGLALDETRLGPDCRETLAWRHGLAVTYMRVGRVSEAIVLHEQLHKASRLDLGYPCPAVDYHFCDGFSSFGRVWSGPAFRLVDILASSGCRSSYWLWSIVANPPVHPRKEGDDDSKKVAPVEPVNGCRVISVSTLVANCSSGRGIRAGLGSDLGGSGVDLRGVGGGIYRKRQMIAHRSRRMYWLVRRGNSDCLSLQAAR